MRSTPRPLRRSVRVVGLLALAPLLGGCLLSRSHVNDSIDPAAVASLEPGRSTAADVVATLGAPAGIVELGDRSAYHYEHRKLKRTGLLLILLNLVNEDTRSDRVWVFFDAEDRLTHVGATLSAERVTYGLPFRDRE